MLKWNRLPNIGKGRGPGGKFFGLWILIKKKKKRQTQNPTKILDHNMMPHTLLYTLCTFGRQVLFNSISLLCKSFTQKVIGGRVVNIAHIYLTFKKRKEGKKFRISVGFRSWSINRKKWLKSLLDAPEFSWNHQD